MSIYRSWIKPSDIEAIANCYGNGVWDKFEESRRKHNHNLCLETNKLVLRLDKLINSDKFFQSKGNGDKSVVEWTLDDLVKLCPFCAKSFTFARRRHHCRACGAILCNSCSKFLEFRAACKLVKPSKLFTDLYDRIEDNIQNQSAEEMPKIRICEDCKRLLDIRVQLIEDYYCQPTFCELYEKLRKCMDETDELILSQNALTLENKPSNLELKTRIQENKEELLLISSKLSKIIQTANSKQAYLLGAINQSVAYWLKEGIDSKSIRTYGRRGNKSKGWVPETVCLPSDLESEENPLLIQIRNLEEYIKQAKLADRYEEVSALEESKRDLEIEYLIQKDLKIEEEEVENKRAIVSLAYSSFALSSCDRAKMGVQVA